MLNIVAIDTETYYDGDCSVKTLGPHAYTRHHKWDCYLVSVFGDGISYVGPPGDFDWDLLRGRKVCAHNAAFDKAQVDALRNKGLNIPNLDWMCTADLSAFLGVKRSLDATVKQLFGHKISKEVRKNMLGKKIEDLRDWDESKLATNKAERKKKSDYEALIQYALDDAQWCYRIADEHVSKWPRKEMDLSQHTREMGAKGVAIDQRMLDKFICRLEDIKARAEKDIPWTEPYLSLGKIQAFCETAGVEPPATIAKSSPVFEMWANANSHAIGWVAPLNKWRVANMHLERMFNIKRRLTSDGILQFGLKYFGAHTGRWSGDQGVNFQNFPRNAWEGCDFRSLIVPRPGHKFIIADFAQIEARTLLWNVNDEVQLQKIREGVSVYEAHARATMGWNNGILKEEDPELYKLAKARVLGLGYQCGKARFKDVAKMMAGIDISSEESVATVNQFRAANPKIKSKWYSLQYQLERNFPDGWFGIPLPSGRALMYHHLTRDGKQIKGEMVRGEGQRKLYGGLITENYIQAVARDVLADKILHLEREGYRVAYHIHDEVVVEVPEAQAKKAEQEIGAILREENGWYTGLPLGIDIQTADCYLK